MPAIDEIRLSIEDQLMAIERELAALTAALETLDDGGGQRRRARSASAVPLRARQPRRPPAAAQAERPPERPRRARRQREELSADRVAAMLAESKQGLSAIAIARQLSVSPNRVISVLRELQDAGRARQEGTRRTSRWLVITDEERIAARAAELAAQSRHHQTQA